MKLDDTFQLSLNPGNINILKDDSSQDILKTNWINTEWSTDFILTQWWDESEIAKFKEEHSDLIKKTTTDKDIMTHILIAEVNHKDFASMSNIFVHLVNDIPERKKMCCKSLAWYQILFCCTFLGIYDFIRDSKKQPRYTY
ncbi:hypothetical protein H2342_004653 [Salmonella enterica]|nr:hypothetical protein [Salmonella enterica]EEG6289975.1 hypothetical protein [Salmonella enterica subsp. enterica]EEJ6747718.1 hypothetical protein [Salmonella enterica subsp. enterica serovar Oslo]EGI6071375.1 hypothetical protein [Salmonella enterica subsp. enterica serovar Denver]EBK9383335.1 hypothetical protein [Salmonella enterica]